MAHQLVGFEPFAERFFLSFVRSVAELDGDGDALLQRAGNLHGGRHQVSHRSQQEEHQGDADVRNDVGVAYPTLESFVVFHGVKRV